MAVYTGKMQAWLDIALIGPLQQNISVAIAVRKKVSETTYMKLHTTERTITWLMTSRGPVSWLYVKVATQICLRLNISQTTQDCRLVSMEQLLDTTYCGKNDHVIDDITW